MGHQMASFPPENLGTPGSSKRGRKPGPGGKSEKAEKVSKTKVAPTVTTLVTETVGWFEDEHVRLDAIFFVLTNSLTSFMEIFLTSSFSSLLSR